MKHLTLIITFLFSAHLYAYGDFDYPSGVCTKEERVGKRKSHFEVGTDQKSKCCQIEDQTKGLYFINSRGEKNNCRYQAAKKISPRRNIAGRKKHLYRKQSSKLALKL